ncbi:uncharacterized protein LOC119628804 isoform X1 [Bombyx mori]|uniref:HTH psq-type domain-containing protein n=1 Tax=Bombyx mori TaxID=7091 RepID=A0A8R2LWV7_BOMMO|nr:uncharacterized protein LOC119628804 [Bombyx mori]
MVYKYKRKTNQAQWSEDSMMLAIADCNSGIPVKTTAKKYGLPYATLYRHWKKGSSTAQLGRFRKVFNDGQEGDLRTYLYEMDSVFYGLTREDFKTLVFEYAKRNNVTYPPSWDKNKKAGDDWLAGFIRRNPQITLRIPEATTIGRVKGFNRPQVERFYKLLSEQIEKCQIDGTRIYNIDETGIQTSTNKPPKVLSVKGKRQVGVISSTERGQTTTVVCCCNASGSFVPPFMIFARKRMQDRLLDGSPPETRGSCSASGWINGEIFLDWLKFFVGHVRPTKDKKLFYFWTTMKAINTTQLYSTQLKIMSSFCLCHRTPQTNFNLWTWLYMVHLKYSSSKKSIDFKRLIQVG